MERFAGICGRSIHTSRFVRFVIHLLSNPEKSAGERDAPEYPFPFLRNLLLHHSPNRLPSKAILNHVNGEGPSRTERSARLFRLHSRHSAGIPDTILINTLIFRTMLDLFGQKEVIFVYSNVESTNTIEQDYMIIYGNILGTFLKENRLSDN